jgi:hypothetical protein
MSTDYIPEGDDECLDWMLNFYNELKDNFTRWGIPDPADPVGLPVMTYKTALTDHRKPDRGKATTKRKNDAKKAAKTACRKYAMAHVVYNEDITNEEKLRIGVHVHDKPPRIRPSRLPSQSARPCCRPRARS